jgi:hypothetical protein
LADIGTCIAAGGLYCLTPALTVWVGLNTAGQTKRAASISIVFFAAAIGGVPGSYIYIAKEARESAELLIRHHLIEQLDTLLVSAPPLLYLDSGTLLSRDSIGFTAVESTKSGMPSQGKRSMPLTLRTSWRIWATFRLFTSTKDRSRAGFGRVRRRELCVGGAVVDF